MTTKTITLTSAEVMREGMTAHIRNDGTEVIYVSKMTGADKTIFIFMKNREMLCDITS